ncbi:MAG: sulfotransferase [Ardenticatenia bacterium]|nr:MAG: sulfotransferase [Ardenticatenia bacterium]
MKRPSFFIIGAPKCGTTSLARWLGEHPNIYMSPIKEPNFFNEEGPNAVSSLEQYEALFAKANETHLAVGEASTHYLFSRTAVPNILAYAPEARFIVCVRNPVEMAPALHAERVWQRKETIGDFEQAWRLQTARREGRHVPPTAKGHPHVLQYGEYCRLGAQLERLYTHVSPERVCVIVLDDMAQNPRRVYQHVLSFLNLPDDGRTDFPVHNRRKRVRSVWGNMVIHTLGRFKRRLGIQPSLGVGRLLVRLNRAKTPQGLSPALRAELCTYFHDDILLLQTLLQRDLRDWLCAS